MDKKGVKNIGNPVEYAERVQSSPLCGGTLQFDFIFEFSYNFSQ